MADAELTPTAEQPRGPEAARLNLRVAGYCVVCDRIVERTPRGGCRSGHPAEAVTGRILLHEGESIPQLPRFNLAAFALPPVWGPAHGQWAGVFFLPIWLFADSVLSTLNRGPIAVAAAVIVAIGTLLFQAFFAKRANGVAWRRVCDKVSVEEYVRRQKIWALTCVPAGALLLGWGMYYRFILS